MPQSNRRDPVAAQRAVDKEAKRARGALSCAECRRLKLKCDKTVPCSSCKRRGCSAICPNGSLITGQGTRFVLADTEKLHAKIAQMSDRIRQLEDALAILQSTQSGDHHPLLHRDLLKIKSSIELHSAVEGEEGLTHHHEDIEESQYIDAFGTLAIRDDGAATFYGRSAGSESLLIGEATSPQQDKSQQQTWNDRIPTSLHSLSSSFPLSNPSGVQPGMDLDQFISSYLLPWPEAWRLCELYLEQAPWFFGAVTKRQLLEEILPLWYPEAPPPPGPSTLTTPQATKGTAHELSLLFVIFCFGALTDMALPPAPDNPEAEHYYQVTKAALALEPVLERPPSVATVQTLALMGIYEGLCSGENSIESTWALMGLATKLAQSIGLHRDCARWKLSPAEVQKRRALFWELFITDCWQSLATGRLATFSLPFVDCELPFDPDQTMTDDESIQPSFPFWKARFGAECVSAVVQGTLTSRAPKYSIILELDRKVRDMELPTYAVGPPPEGQGLARTMSHFMPTNYRELTLLYIHRCFFAHAISSHPLDPIKSQYAPSFLAGYRSACTILGSVRQQFSLFPAQIARFWVLWTHAFSASVMLASVVTHSSQSKVAPAALLELRTAYELFQQASAYGGRAVKFFPIIQRLQRKAHQVYIDANSGLPPSIPNDIFRPSSLVEHQDELSIFSGKTHTVATTKAGSPPSARTQNSASPQSQSVSPHGQGQGQQQHAMLVTNNPSFAGVHPSLVSELHEFEGQIAARIRDAYRETGGTSVLGHGGRFVAGRRGDQQEQDAERERVAREMEIVRREATARQAQQQQQMQEQYERQQFQEQQQRLQELERIEQQRKQQQAETRALAHRQSQQFREPHQQHYQPSVAHPQYQQQYDQASVLAHGASGPAPPSQFPKRSLVHSQSLSNLHTTYGQPQAQVYQPHHRHHQPSLYVIPPDHRHPQGSPESDTSAPISSAMSHFPETVYGGHVPPQQPQPIAEPTYNDYQQTKYWPTMVPNSFAQGHGQHQYTPEGALRGIAADDYSLQETWQSYMYKVGSPRHLFED